MAWWKTRKQRATEGATGRGRQAGRQGRRGREGANERGREVMQCREHQHVAPSLQPTDRLLQQQHTRQSSQRPGGIAPCRRVAGRGRRPEGDADRAHWCRSCKQLSCTCRAGGGRDRGREGRDVEESEEAESNGGNDATRQAGRERACETGRNGVDRGSQQDHRRFSKPLGVEIPKGGSKGRQSLMQGSKRP